ncbi:hypothetical protein C8R32_1017 [Nitrosospira sp. Nsp5]|uniref:Uncharacterized protein n=1 Tax=Nitrosospira multiformis TaxID=1231 RepID=A0ABY0THA6_9PROT|nr:hypothetical protein C8R32_1017 [Nitrosospira sp. Nsp5]SDQ82849.1 hypothetical protein SAMN05216402_2456 [Nitrosospira multiformis]
MGRRNHILIKQAAGYCYRSSIHGANNEFPAYHAKFEGVLVLVLHGKRLPVCDDYLMATTRASVNSRVRHGSAGRILFIKLDMLGLNKKACVLIVCHDCPGL